MFDPGNRSVYLENLQPPDGYRLECALATTFSLDLMSLLMAPLSMIMSEAQDKDEALKDPIALIESLQRSAGRIVVFCQQGRISIPKTETRLYRYLEQSVVEVRTPDNKGVFHPKVWILKFTSDNDYTIYRVLCLSRNLTFDRSWDTLLSLEGYIEDHRHVNKENKPLCDFIRALSGLSIYPINAHIQKLINQMVRDIQSVWFEKPDGFQDVLEFIPLGFPGNKNKFFLDKSDRSLILSPFLSDSILSQLGKHGQDNMLISRLESLDKIDAYVLRSIQERSKIYVFSDEADISEEQNGGKNVDDIGDIKTSIDSELLTGLHAKLYITEKGETTNIYFGSANATDAGLNGRNAEILIGLTADRQKVSIDSLFSFDDKDGISSMLSEYRRGSSRIKEDDILQKLERMLDELRDIIIQTSLKVTISPAENGSAYDIEVTANNIPRQVDFLRTTRIYPVTLDKSYAHRFEDLLNERKIVFSSVSVISLTCFFAFEIFVEYKDNKQQSSFVLNLPIEGIPEERDRAILQSIISDRGKFIRYILLLLTEENDPSRMINMMSRYRYGLDDEIVAAARNIPLLEELIRAYSRTPDKLDRINEIVRDLSLSDEKNDILPDGFEEVWNVFRQVLSEDKNNEP
jgi:hypothetical protein